MTDKEKAVPDYAHVVVVPIANPRTATELLRLAQAFARRDGGRVIALAVTLGDADTESNRARLEELEAIVEKMRPPQDGASVEMKTPPIVFDFVSRTAGSIARGILDEARESGAELIILGVQKPVRGEVTLGTITQNVMSAASCDVLVYRLSEHTEFSRIVVAVDDKPISRMAVRMGILFGNAFPSSPVEAVHVEQPDWTAERHGRMIMAKALDQLPGNGAVKQTLLEGESVAETILARLEPQHLVIMGFARRADLQRWIDGDSPTRRILDRAPGPVLLAVRSPETVTPSARIRRRVLGWLRPTLTDIEREQVVWTANINASITFDYVILMIVAATLASLGLLLNSAAVIIGAMLVAPLMSPLNAFAVGLSTARLDLILRALLTTLVGVAIASLVGWIMGTLVPLQVPTSEMMGRVAPNLLDAGVALAAGVVGSYATARKDIPAALAGVAIAAALVPPICTFGLMLAFGKISMSLGAGLLFLTNMVSIIVIATGVFAWLGLSPLRLSRVGWVAYSAVMSVVIVALVGVFGLLNVTAQGRNASEIERQLRAIFEGMTIRDLEVDFDNPNDVTFTLLYDYDIGWESVAYAEQTLRAEIGEPITLHVIPQRTLSANGLASSLPISSPFELVDGVVVPKPQPAPPEPTPEEASAAADE